MIKNLRFYGICTVFLALISLHANGNGINPPRPSGTETIALSCVDRGTGDSITVLRAKIIGETELSSWLEARLGKAAPQRLQLSQITRIQLPSGKPLANGFSKAELEIREPNYSGTGMVRSRIKGKSVRITGFSSDLERIELPLESCKDITQSSQQMSETNHHNVSKR